MSLINCEIEKNISWTKYYVLTKQYNDIAGVNFVINSSKIYVPVVTLSINENINFRKYKARI